VEVIVCEHGLLVVCADRRHPVPRLGELRLDVRPRLGLQPLHLEERPPGWVGGGRSEPQISCGATNGYVCTYNVLLPTFPPYTKSTEAWEGLEENV
jgi:hypothetical protein